MSNIALIGHSHAVSILDGIGDWRPQVRLGGKQEDVRFTRAFQGWFSVDTGGELFRVKTHPEFEALSGIQVCLVTKATFPGELASIDRCEQGATSVKISDFLGRFVNKVSGFDAIVSVIQGSEHATLGLINMLPEYDFPPYEGPLECQPIDSMYIDAIVSEMTSPVVTPLAFMKSAIKNAKILHVPPPPPLRNPAKAPVFEAFRHEKEKYGFVRPGLSQKWHTMYVSKLKAQLESLNVILVDPSFEEACEDGFLKPEYAEGLTHGNSAYGKLVGSRIVQLLGL